jgi:hypothetical protein
MPDRPLIIIPADGVVDGVAITIPCDGVGELVVGVVLLLVNIPLGYLCLFMQYSYHDLNW